MAEQADGGGEKSASVGGKKFPIWPIAIGAVAAVGIFLWTKITGGGGGDSTGLASAQYDQAVSTLRDTLNELNKRIAALEPVGGTTATPAAPPEKAQLFRTWEDLANELVLKGTVGGQFYRTVNPYINVIDTGKYVYVEKFSSPTVMSAENFVKAVRIPRDQMNFTTTQGLVGIPPSVLAQF
jgi:hypothetical protein